MKHNLLIDISDSELGEVGNASGGHFWKMPRDKNNLNRLVFRCLSLYIKLVVKF